ncbi:MAG: class II aldolase/adducin family protein [Candidatus Sumerlaeia bacterium]|nr:class II aldolase/adducin family protein [Candidatus Sumerlaeia bacterium]
MEYDLIHPRDMIPLLMDRVYKYGMTTTSGGNLSIKDEEGNIWISPSGVDKGSLQWEDIVCVKPDGTVKGRHKPSSELPFHQAIYEARPDLKGIVHAHPSALVSFSLVGKAPPIRIIPQAYYVCGSVGVAPYALPGSDQLGKNIAETFAKGYDAVVLENHGIVCGASDLLRAFHCFETLDFCARLAIKASMIGGSTELSDVQIDLFRKAGERTLPEFDLAGHTNKEKAMRRHICEITHRAYDQQLMTSTEGVVSVRLDEDSFLITPTGKDRRLLSVEDIVFISKGRREKGKHPSRSVGVHSRIYKDHPEINAIVSAQTPNITAFAVSEAPLQTRTIPESYILLRQVPIMEFGPQFIDPGKVSSMITPQTPVLLLKNDAVLTTGETLLQAFDRLEVAEFTAESLIDARLVGELRPIADHEIAELEEAFNLPKG